MKRLSAVLLALVMASCYPSPEPVGQDSVARTLPTRMRGFNAGNLDTFTAADVERIGKLGANVVRWNLKSDSQGALAGAAPTSSNPLGAYSAFIERLDALLPTFRAYDIKLIISLDDFYGRSAPEIWQREAGSALREHIVDFWRAFAERYRHESVIAGYDIVNEPAFAEGDYDIWWQDLLPRCIESIRRVDSTVWIVVEPCIRERQGLEAKISAIQDSRVLISFHFYKPLTYTHQGLPGIPAVLRIRGYLMKVNTGTNLHWKRYSN